MGPARIPPEFIEAPALARRLYRDAADHGMTETGLQILVFLVQVDQAAFVDVQRALELEQTRVSHAVKGLKDASLVDVSPDLGDPRKRLITPTRTGRALVRKFIRGATSQLREPREA